MKNGNIVKEKSFDFSIRIVNLYKHLTFNKQEFVLSKQLLRAGTSIGANICEAEQAQSTSDFISKLSIALKESCETEYWLRLLYRTDYLSESEFNSIISDNKNVTKLLTSIIKSTKTQNNSINQDK